MTPSEHCRAHGHIETEPGDGNHTTTRPTCRVCLTELHFCYVCDQPLETAERFEGHQVDGMPAHAKCCRCWESS